jgi:hypothetical protein
MLIYLYDLHAKVRDYNRIKRMFYYNLKKSKLGASPWRTKSALVVRDENEAAADEFFKGYEGVVEVYKVRAQGFEEVV